MRRSSIAAVLVLALGLVVAAVRPAAAELGELKPQILEEIDALKKAVAQDDVPAALESNQLIDAWLREAQAADISAVFLDVSGWDKELGDSQSAGQAFLGGGVSANCTYTEKETGKVVDVHILGNSPMFGMVSGMMGMAVASGKKVKRIAGNKAILDDSDGAELQIPFEGNTLVSVDGPDVDSAVHIAESGVGWEALRKSLGQ